MWSEKVPPLTPKKMPELGVLFLPPNWKGSLASQTSVRHSEQEVQSQGLGHSSPCLLSKPSPS